MLINGITAAVLGFRINEGNKAIPGARYIKNIKLNNANVYIVSVFINCLLNDLLFRIEFLNDLNRDF